MACFIQPGIMLIGFLVLELGNTWIVQIFGLSGLTQDLMVYAIRIISLSLLCAGANIAYQGIFQALDGGKESLFISLGRQFLFVLPIAYLLAVWIGFDVTKIQVVFFTFLIAETITCIGGYVMLKRIIHLHLMNRNEG